MADILSQLQILLTQLSDQFTASLAYTLTSSSPSALQTSTSQPPINPPAPSQQQQQQQQQQQPQSPSPATTTAPAAEEFLSAQKELATDLILKIKQIKSLIGVLPGLENSTERQRARIRDLEREIQDVEAERRELVRERERGVEVLEGVLAGVRRW